jgi:hypothetical protein
MITTNKKINLEQLDFELGSFGLIADFNDPTKQLIGVADNSPVTQEQLAEAISNHIASPSREEIRLLNKQQGMAKLKELGFTDDQITGLLS